MGVNTLLQRIIPHHWFSRQVSRLSHARFCPFKTWAIKRYICKYQVNIEEALETDISQYANLNAFFTRALRPEARPVDATNNSIISPVDGMVQQCGHIADDGQLLSVKGHTYTLKQLLGGGDHQAKSDVFNRGCFINCYLSPRDYHRVHMPLTGKLRSMWTVPGQLFAVNPQTVAAYPDIFIRNERVVCWFDTTAGPLCIILVGAMIVSGIRVAWAGKQTPNHDQRVRFYDYSTQSPVVTLAKGEEMGLFEFGSTVIVLLTPDARCQWQPTLTAGAQVQFGQCIGKLT